jgi:hypothetical protein
MNTFLENLLDGNRRKPSDICLQAFDQNFQNTINVDWYDRGSYFEAIFYKDNLEHIALFNPSGSLLEYRLNLPDGYLPETIRNKVESKGEIMNTVMRNKGNTVEYEVIVRDKELNRYLITFSDIGNILEEKKL